MQEGKSRSAPIQRGTAWGYSKRLSTGTASTNGNPTRLTLTRFHPSHKAPQTPSHPSALYLKGRGNKGYISPAGRRCSAKGSTGKCSRILKAPTLGQSIPLLSNLGTSECCCQGGDGARLGSVPLQSTEGSFGVLSLSSPRHSLLQGTLLGYRLQQHTEPTEQT